MTCTLAKDGNDEANSAHSSLSPWHTTRTLSPILRLTGARLDSASWQPRQEGFTKTAPYGLPSNSASFTNRPLISLDENDGAFLSGFPWDCPESCLLAYTARTRPMIRRPSANTKAQRSAYEA